MHSLSHQDVTLFLLAIAVLLASARILGELAQRWGQPAVLGEILAGILLGPTLFGAWLPEWQAKLFPSEGAVPVALHGVTVLAITMYLLVAGMEVDLSAVWRQGKVALAVGLAGIVVPFGLSFLPAWLAPRVLGAMPDVDPFVFALFFATAMSITALPVIAKILLDLNLFRSDLGVTIIAAAIFNDLIGWIIFAFVLALLGGHSASLSAGQIAILTGVFTVLMLTVGRWLLNRVLPWVQAHASWPGGILGFALCLALFCAALTEGIGTHAIFGAFLFGVALGDSAHLHRRTRTTIDQFVSFIFAPLFFASIGLRVDFVHNFDLALVLAILTLATIGKVGGCTLAARWMGFAPNEARAIGFGMNARGAMEIILGLLALEAGIIGQRLFVALVIMALVTSLASGTLIQRSFGRRRREQFVDYLTPKSFLPQLQSLERRGAITELAELAAATAGLDAAAVTEAVWRRERIVSSAVGRGVAVPHARLTGISEPIVTVGLSQRGIDFDAPDGMPVKVVVLMLSPPDRADVHLAILASISHAFHKDRVAQELAARVPNLTELRAFLKIETPPAPPV